VAEASAIASAPSAISSDPPITCPYVVAAPPRSSPNTSNPHASPHSWFVLDSGIPRLMPTYFAAYCWNRSPTTHTNPAEQEPEQDVARAAELRGECGDAAAVDERERQHHHDLAHREKRDEGQRVHAGEVGFAIGDVHRAPQRTGRERCGDTPRCMSRGCPGADATASSVAPANISAAPPRTPRRRPPAGAVELVEEHRTPQDPSRLFAFHKGKAMLRPMSRMAKMVSVLATAQRHPASTAHTMR